MADSSDIGDETNASCSGDAADKACTMEKLQEKIAVLEAEQLKQHKDFGTQRAKYKEIYEQKEGELNSVLAENEKLAAELNDVRNELFASELQRNSYLSEKRKCDDEIASLQKIVNDTMDENQNIRDELERIREAFMNVESENSELRRVINEDKERSSDPLPIQKFTQVTKSFARKVMSELGADSTASPSKESLDDDMRKAHEDAEVLRSLMIPLEAEIQSLKDKLRDADQRLREYEQERTGKLNEEACIQHGTIQEGQIGEENKEVSATASDPKSPSEEPLIQLSPSSPMESAASLPVCDAKPSPQESRDLAEFFGSGSETTFQTTEDVSKCDKCQQFEADLSKTQQQLSEAQKALENSERAAQRARDDLNRERTSRHELETKWNAVKDQYDEQVVKLDEMLSKTEQSLSDVRHRYEKLRSSTEDQLKTLNMLNVNLRGEIGRIHQTNEELLGKHSRKASELQDLEINLPNTVPELHELLLRQGEDLITAKISAETHEHQVLVLQTQLNEFQRQSEEWKIRERSRSMEFGQLRKTLDDYSKVIQRHEDSYNKLMCEKETLQKQLLEEIDKRKKLENSVQDYHRQVQLLQKDLMNSEHVQKDFVCLSQNLQRQLELLRNENTEVRWQHDEDVEQCPTCKQAFNHLNRKKVHCRHCGHIFCSLCLSYTVKSGPRQRPSRVCEVCHTLLVPDTAPYYSTEPPSALD